MSNPNDKPILSSGGAGLSGPLRAANPILRGMAKAILRRAKSGDLGDERFRLGNYEFRRPDYNQILAWAKALEMEPLELLAVLVDTSWDLEDLADDSLFETCEFVVEDGAIINLAWDFDRLPVLPEAWEADLSIRSFGTSGHPPTGSLLLPRNQLSLQQLDCSKCQLGSLDLEGIDSLVELYCYSNRISSLSLANLHELRVLFCDNNQLKSLELGANLGLTDVGCDGNQLTELDLEHASELVHLSCHSNSIQEIRLPDNNKLRAVRCSKNNIRRLNLRNSRSLYILWCEHNFITELNLSCEARCLLHLFCSFNQLNDITLQRMPMLAELECRNNKLKSLAFPSIDLECAAAFANLEKLNCIDNLIEVIDASNLRFLEVLMCDINRLGELDLENCDRLEVLSCSQNLISWLEIDSLKNLKEVNCSHNSLSFLSVAGLHELKELDCSFNHIEELKLYNHSLERLSCNDNDLTILELVWTPALTTLNCSNNPLMEIDLPSTPDLTTLVCRENDLAELDLWEVPLLEELDCSQNDITELDLSGNTALKTITCDASVELLNCPPGLVVTRVS